MDNKIKIEFSYICVDRRKWLGIDIESSTTANRRRQCGWSSLMKRYE